MTILYQAAVILLGGIIGVTLPNALFTAWLAGLITGWLVYLVGVKR